MPASLQSETGHRTVAKSIDPACLSGHGGEGTEVHESLNRRRSSFSGSQGGNCVEVAVLSDGGMAVRHSNNPAGSVIAYTAAEWDAFLTGVKKAGEFDR
jgi:Domain of unknown function (DUF397)